MDNIFVTSVDELISVHRVENGFKISTLDDVVKYYRIKVQDPQDRGSSHKFGKVSFF